MSLRVLLADESPSIKKAFDLALKDFAVTVQTVHQGTDVLELFSSFQPDICFLDVLLPKKNGYDACTDIKQSGQTKTPVVLMWSNFMEVDESKFKDCGAEAKIEKPFETKTLREIVLEHVPKVKQNKISAFLEPIAKQEHESNDSQEQSTGASAVPPLKEDVIEAQSETDPDMALPDLPDINSILDDPPDTPNEDGGPDALDDFDPTSGAEQTDASPDESDDDPFGSLDLQDSGSENDDLENFQMEPLESFGPQGGDAQEEDLPPAMDSASQADPLEEIPPLKPLDNEAFGGADAPFGDKEEDTDPSISLSGSLEIEPPPLSDEDDEVTDPSASGVAIETPPLPDDMAQETQDFSSEDDEPTDPSISVVDEPLISPPPPPAFEAPNMQASEAKTQEVGSTSKSAGSNESNSKGEAGLNLDSQLSKDELKRLIMAQSKDIIESVVWEVVPELAKEMIKKEIERLTGELNPNEEAR